MTGEIHQPFSYYCATDPTFLNCYNVLLCFTKEPSIIKPVYGDNAAVRILAGEKGRGKKEREKKEEGEREREVDTLWTVRNMCLVGVGL